MATQNGWRWCSRCQCMTYSGFGKGICYDGEPHYLDDSGPYLIPIGDTPPGAQDGWRWCSRCQVLVYGGFGDGSCWDGEPHYLGDSSPYSLALGETPQGMQDGWRWCSRCQVLVYGGFGSGICWDGRRHYLDDSGPYSVAFEDTTLRHPPAPPPAPPPLAIEVSERYDAISVTGERFTPGGTVRVSFVRGGDVKKVSVTASTDGRISHVERAFDPEYVGGAVITTDLATGRWTAGRTYRYFPQFRPVTIDKPGIEQ